MKAMLRIGFDVAVFMIVVPIIFAMWLTTAVLEAFEWKGE